MKPKSILLLVIAGSCGLVAAIATAQHLTGNQPAPQPGSSEPLESVVVAQADQEAGTQLKEDMLKVVEMPAKDLPEGTFSAVAEVTGQTLRYPVFKGEPVLSAKLGGGLAALAKNLPQGMKAYTVKVAEDDGRMSGLINPGDHVDVWWLPTRTDLSNASVRMLLQNVKVLAVGQRIDADEPEAPGARDAKSSDNYTLQVSGQQHRRLIAATSMGGRFRLSLRGRDDKTIEEVDEQALDMMLGLIPRPPVEKPQPTAEPTPEPQVEKYEVEIVLGNEIVTETLNIPEGRSLLRN